MRHTFPQDEGWKVGDKSIRLSHLSINLLTKLFTKPTEPPNCEMAWNSRLGLTLPWDEIWASLGTFLLNPRDEYTWFRFLHRGLFVMTKQNTLTSSCRFCRRCHERLQHLPSCKTLLPLRKLVRRFLKAMRIDLTSLSKNPKLLFGFGLDKDNKVITCKASLSLLRLFWRVMYRHLTRISEDSLSTWYVDNHIAEAICKDLARSQCA